MAELCLERETWAANAFAEAQSPVAKQASISRMRAELLQASVEEMNSSGIAYCLLSGFQEYPEATDSDVDFMVVPEDIDRVAPLLKKSPLAVGRCWCRRCSTRRQPITSCWRSRWDVRLPTCIRIARPTTVARDGCGWRQRRCCRQRKRHGGSSYRHVADEFQYYLMKKLLKQSLSEDGVATLGNAVPERSGWLAANGCGGSGRGDHRRKLVSALVRHDIAWMRSRICRHLSAELRRSDPQESWWRRVSQRVAGVATDGSIELRIRLA